MKLVLTCEHGGNKIPIPYKKYFNDNEVLETHIGYDIGALDLFQHLEPLSDSSFYSTTSRLLVELNRSLHHSQLFSNNTRNISKTEKDQILNTYYTPYRNEVEKTIQDYINKDFKVLHLSIHSFTLVFNGEKRNADIGLLYDSRQTEEKVFCKNFKSELLKHNPKLNIRFNYPYLGKADGFTSYLRKRFSENYLGIEIEVNQKYSVEMKMDIDLKSALYKTIKSLVPI